MSSQLGLFGRRDADEGISFARARRVALDATSWVEHIEGWWPTPDALFAELAAIEGWEQRKRWMFTELVEEPRLTAEYHQIGGSPAAIVTIGELLSAHYRVPYDRVWMNFYRDQRDSTSWHADRPCRRAECIVPVLSLGETRRFLLRPRDGGRSVTFVAQSGDLVVMGGRCQHDWVHCVPKETYRCGGRISINFGSRFQDVAE